MFVILMVHTVILLCWSVLYTRHLLHVCLSWERDPSSVALPEVSSIFFLSKEFILVRIERLRTEDVVRFTDCKDLRYWIV